MAHSEAASDRGPRANKQKAAIEQNEYDNLILLCKNCHARLDGQKNSNTVEYIRQLWDELEAAAAITPPSGQDIADHMISEAFVRERVLKPSSP